MSQPIVALDLGSTKVACAIGLPHEHAPGFELLGSSVVAYPTLSEVWLGDPLLASRTIEQALEATAVRADAQQALVAIDHPLLVSERVRTAVTLGDEPVTVRAQDLERLQTGALDQTLGVDREPLLVERLGCTGNGFDGVRDPRGLPATRLLGTFHIITMPMAVRRAAVQAVESAGLEIAKLSYSLPAVFSGIADDAGWRRRVLLLDAGGLSTHLGLFVEGVLADARTAPRGGIHLAAEIAKHLHVTMEQAVTWSLEGSACKKPGVRALVERQWDALRDPLSSLLKDSLRPDAVIVTGRGALLDGFVEWVERTTTIPTSLGRSARVSRAGDLSRQVGLSGAIGLLEGAARAAEPSLLRSPRLLNRLIDRTRTLLTEYF